MAQNKPQNLLTEIPNIVTTFDGDAFDTDIRSQGVKLVHYTAIRCPVGMVDLDSNRKPHDDHAGCSNGFLFEKAGTITALLTGNSKNERLEDIGWVHGASASTTFPRYYDPEDDGCPPKPFYAAPFDRFYLNEESIIVPTWQLAQMNGSGVERMNFPVVYVERLMDFRGDKYIQGTDFDVNKHGQIVWRSDGKRPVSDLDTGQGAVISIRYFYRPFWYLARMIHEIRVAAQDNPITGERHISRMPQSALLNREFLFLNETNDDMARNSNSLRQEQTPESGGFGPK